jgi:hypothetical protein
MHHRTNLEHAIQHGQELRADAARASVAAAARQARSRQFRCECDRRIGRSALGRRPLADRRRRTGVASSAPVRVVSSARSQPFGDLVAAVADRGLATSRAEVNRFVHAPAARCARTNLLSIVQDEALPDVVRERALGRVLVELSKPDAVSSARSDAV